MSSIAAFLVPFRDGVLVGLAVAMPIGPMAMLCMQRTVAHGMAIGVSTGLGSATMNLVYGALALVGLDAVAPWLAPGSHALSGIGGLLLLRSAVRTWLRAAVPAPASAIPALSPRVAYGSAVLISATNPASLMSIVALLTPLRLAGEPAGPVLAGMFIAACGWWVCFAAAVAIGRTWLSPAVLRLVNRVAGALLSLYAASALARSMAWHALRF